MSSFSQQVYELCLLVPQGKVTTYKTIAEKLGTKSYRAVGQALRCNPFSPRVPCHRVVRSDGSLGGFMGWKEGGKVAEKWKMLEEEGVLIDDEGRIDLLKYGFDFENVSDSLLLNVKMKHKKLFEYAKTRYNRLRSTTSKPKGINKVKVN